MKKVAVIMGSDSDLPVVQKAIDTVRSFGVECEAHVYSAHRTPAEAKAFAENAEKNGFGVIIAAAGKAAHLAGALAASTTLPVIGIPVKSSALDGLDALLSTVQMPKGSRKHLYLSVDGGKVLRVTANERVEITQSQYSTRLVQLAGRSFYQVINQKLGGYAP